MIAFCWLMFLCEEECFAISDAVLVIDERCLTSDDVLATIDDSCVAANV